MTGPVTTIRFRTAAQRMPDVGPSEPDGDLSDGWYPDVWLGAPATYGLALPAAQPTASWLYAPRGVHLGVLDGHEVLVVADTGNHRVLIWNGLPDKDEQPCDVVLGQPDATSEGPAAGRGDTRRGLYLPTGVLIHDGALVVADAWHHRVLVYRSLSDACGANIGMPQSLGTEPDLVLGQPDLDSVEPNRGGQCSAASMYWPFGIAVCDDWFYVADTGNRRVLGWSGGIPESPDVPADVILGQPDANSREENRGGPAGAASFRWPHDVCVTPDRVLVADAGNHRVLGWLGRPDTDRHADVVLGQPDFVSCAEWPYGPQRADITRFPYAVDASFASGGGGGADRLAVADTANNRILLWNRPWDDPDAGGPARGADAVLGQPGFAANGENRWTGVTRDSLCWPYGLSLRGDRLAVADSGNNRVVIWSRR